MVSPAVVSDAFATQLTLAHQAPLSVGVFKQEHCSGCHFLLQGIFLTQGSSLRLLHRRWALGHLSHRGPCFLDFLPILVATEQGAESPVLQ